VIVSAKATRTVRVAGKSSKIMRRLPRVCLSYKCHRLVTATSNFRLMQEERSGIIIVASCGATNHKTPAKSRTETMGDDPLVSYRSSLSIDPDDEDGAFTDDGPPLQTRILSIVKSCPNLTIRPARLSQELGISVNDASAELCGLLAAVGEGSTFHFEDVQGVKAMVFTYPPDFERKALQKQRTEDFKSFLQGALKVAIKVVKILTAFGLILSLLIVSIAAMLALVAALVAVSRGDSRGGRNVVVRQMRNIFLTLRQVLWCYALFGPDHMEGQDSFLRESAYDMSLVFSLCCGNPGSFFFWHRASMLRRRRRQAGRGWGQRLFAVDDSVSGVEGVSLVRRGEWGDEPVTSSSTGDAEHRGLLSVAVEFLFGPTSPTAPTEADKWRLRGAFIEQKSLPNSTSISLEELSPYSDNPPASLNETSKVVSEGLAVVAHFNGVPSDVDKSITGIGKAHFIFPELIAESKIATRYDDPLDTTTDDESLEGLFYIKEASASHGRTTRTGEVPSFLKEDRVVFTKLQSKQFYHCLGLGVLNVLGVLWFAQSLEPGGILEPSLGAAGDALKWGVIPVLKIYAKLFFAIPATRLLWIMGCNMFRKKRNVRRGGLASALKAS
jgi:hypothetical protein